MNINRNKEQFELNHFITRQVIKNVLAVKSSLNEIDVYDECELLITSLRSVLLITNGIERITSKRSKKIQ